MKYETTGDKNNIHSMALREINGDKICKIDIIVHEYDDSITILIARHGELFDSVSTRLDVAEFRDLCYSLLGIAEDTKHKWD